eukprot:1191853-Prorocentrum_minimum.AAC.2
MIKIYKFGHSPRPALAAVAALVIRQPDGAGVGADAHVEHQIRRPPCPPLPDPLPGDGALRVHAHRPEAHL